jgi:hypothetical protein
MKGVGTDKGLRSALELLVELSDMNASSSWNEVAKLWNLPKQNKATLPQLIAGLIGLNGLNYDEGLSYDWPEETVFGLNIKTFKDQVRKEREAKAKETAKTEKPAAKGKKKAGAK